MRVDPDKLVAYGLSIGQVEQQLANNNINAGGSFIEQGMQQINVQAHGSGQERAGHREDGAEDAERDGPAHPGHCHGRAGAEDPAGADRQGHASGRRQDCGQSPTWWKGLCCCKRATTPTPCSRAFTKKVDELNNRILPKGVKVVPFLDRSDLVQYTTQTVVHNLTEGMILVSIILFLFLGNVRGAIIVALTIPFALLFASICLDLSHIPANLLSLGALDFGMVVDGAVVMIENIVRHLPHKDDTRTPWQKIREAAHEVQRPVFYAIGIIITAYLPIFTLQAVEGRLFKPMAWTVAFALLGALMFSIIIAPVLASILFPKGAKEWHNPVMAWLTKRYRHAVTWAIEHRSITLGVRWLRAGAYRLSGLERRDRVGVPAAPGRRRDLGARHAGAQHRPDRGHRRDE